MGLFDRLRKAFSGSSAGADSEGYNYWFYVRCDACGEVIRGRVDLRNELSRRDDGYGFFVRKRLIGSKRCFQPIDVVLYFDDGRRLQEREIEHGAFVEASDYEAPS